MNKHFGAALFFIILFVLHAAAQNMPYDTLRIMAYNVNNYGFPSTVGCPLLASTNKPLWLRTVLQYAAPDILGLEKMAASPATFSTDTIVQQVLDSVCKGCYGHTPFTNNSGYAKTNLLYYNIARVGWLSTTTIYAADSNISDINLHHLFYKSPSLATTHDTIFLNIILVHLESGSGSTAERAAEISGAMSWLNAHVNSAGNYIFMGDFNTISSNESCFQQIINSSNPYTKFYDPPNQLGNWENDPTSFAHFLTQSTRTTDPGDCGATGGMDDRFDHVLCTSYLMAGTDSLQYIDSSFTVPGQDGLHTNKSLIATPANISVPDSVLTALYYMSEHLPVMLQLAVGGKTIAAGIPPVDDEEAGRWMYDNFITSEMRIKFYGPAQKIAGSSFTATVYDLQGTLIVQAVLNAYATNKIDAALMPGGLYVLRICQNNVPVFNGKFVKLSR